MPDALAAAHAAALAADHATPPGPAWRWDVFCRVIDNHGDLGVCWRFSAQLGARGHTVRLWVDDPAALAWMAPGGAAGVSVHPWTEAAVLPPPGDVVVEAFGCDPPAAFVAAMAARAAAGQPAPVWINLEYLSAEPYVERSHRLGSPQMAGPGRGLWKWFFYPGLTAATGGLLREPDLAAWQEAFDGPGWLQRQLGLVLGPGEGLATLFCYAAAPVDRLMDALAASGRPWCLATTPGHAGTLAAAARARGHGGPGLRLHALPWLAQPAYDRLLRAADLNAVRGEDSFVRAQWAGRPWLWHIYPQHDGVHAAKLAAWLDRALAGAEPATAAQVRAWHAAWNGLAAPANAPGLGADSLPAWARESTRWRAEMLAADDLVTRLLPFVAEKR